MKKELNSVVNFVVHLVQQKGCECRSFSTQAMVEFGRSLYDVLSREFSDYWFPDNPSKDAGMRTIRITDRSFDPWIAEAVEACRLQPDMIRSRLPTHLHIWCDPAQVVARIGLQSNLIVLYDELTQPGCSSWRSPNIPGENEPQEVFQEHLDVMDEDLKCLRDAWNDKRWTMTRSTTAMPRAFINLQQSCFQLLSICEDWQQKDEPCSAVCKQDKVIDGHFSRLFALKDRLSLILYHEDKNGPYVATDIATEMVHILSRLEEKFQATPR